MQALPRIRRLRSNTAISNAVHRMRYQGRLQGWNDDKGYGFVVPNGGGERAFVHIKAFEQRPRRPADGVLITYELHKDARGRNNATGIRMAASEKARNTAPRSSQRLPRVWMGLAALLLLAITWHLQWIPDWAAATVAGLSIAALTVYAHDKAAAQQGRRRTPESTLHLIALLGGWPGALMAQGLFRHKSSKRSFQVTFWITVALNLAGLAALARGWVASIG